MAGMMVYHGWQGDKRKVELHSCINCSNGMWSIFNMQLFIPDIDVWLIEVTERNNFLLLTFSTSLTNGLRHNDYALQKLLYLSGKGLHYTYIPSVRGGTTAPITVAASAAIVHAGILTGLGSLPILENHQPESLPVD